MLFMKHTTMSPLGSKLHLTSFFATPPEVLVSRLSLSSDVFIELEGFLLTSLLDSI